MAKDLGLGYSQFHTDAQIVRGRHDQTVGRVQIPEPAALTVVAQCKTLQGVTLDDYMYPPARTRRVDRPGRGSRSGIARDRRKLGYRTARRRARLRFHRSQRGTARFGQVLARRFGNDSRRRGSTFRPRRRSTAPAWTGEPLGQKDREIGLEPLIFPAEALDLLVGVETGVDRIIERIAGKGAGKFAFGGIDPLPHQIGLRGVGLELAKFPVVKNRRNRVLDVLLVQQARLEVRLGSILAPFLDDFEKRAQRLLISPLAKELLATAVAGVIALRGDSSSVPWFTTGQHQEDAGHDQEEQRTSGRHRTEK